MKINLSSTGLFTICFGAMCAESKNLLIPLAFMAVGVVLLKIGNGFEA